MTYHDITRVVKRALSRRKAESAGLALVAALAAGGLVATGSSSTSSVLAPSAQFVSNAVVSDSELKPVETGAKWDLANLDHRRVDSWIGRFTSDLKRSFATYLDRMDTYQPMISTKLAQRDMPQDLIYLA